MKKLMLLLAPALMWPAAASAEWRKASSEHFIVYGDVPEAGLRAFTEELERFDHLLRVVTKVARPPSLRKLTVYVVENDERLRRLTGTGGTAIAGMYSKPIEGARAIVPFKKTSSNSWGLEGVEILRHEYAHHFMWQHAPAPYPAWYSEGFADYYSTARFTDPQTAIVGAAAKSRAMVIRHQGYVSWPQILTYGTNEVNFGAMALYSQGWMLVHAMATNRELRTKINVYLDAIGQGRGPADAYKAGFGETSYLEDTMREYAKKTELGALQLKLRAAPAPLIAMSPLGAAENALLDLTIKLNYAREPKRIAAVASDVAQRAAAFGSDPYALELAARAATAAKDHKGAVSAADRLLKAVPGSSAGLLLKGLALSAEAEGKKDPKSPLWREARSLIVKANAADPDNPHILFAYYRTFPAQGAAPPGYAVDALNRAFELYPQNDEVRLAVAGDFERRERFADALAVLKPLAHDPHRSEKEGELASMLKRLQEATTKATAKP